MGLFRKRKDKAGRFEKISNELMPTIMLETTKIMSDVQSGKKINKNAAAADFADVLDEMFDKLGLIPKEEAAKTKQQLERDAITANVVDVITEHVDESDNEQPCDNGDADDGAESDNGTESDQV